MTTDTSRLALDESHPFQNDPGIVRWKIHFQSPAQNVYRALSSNEGRRSFWAESANEHDGVIEFEVPGSFKSAGRILHRQLDRRFVVEYFGWTCEFDLLPSEDVMGTDLTLTCRAIPESHRMEVAAGWVSVLMAMKAWVDHGVDLRCHDPQRTWWYGYADN